jgi:hypothetical protein
MLSTLDDHYHDQKESEFIAKIRWHSISTKGKKAVAAITTNMKICDTQGLFFLTPQTNTIEQSHIVLRKFSPIIPHYFWKSMRYQGKQN